MSTPAPLPETMAAMVTMGHGGLDQMVWQIEHDLKRTIADDQPEIAVINRQALTNQVKTGSRHSLDLFVRDVQFRPPRVTCVTPVPAQV